MKKRILFLLLTSCLCVILAFPVCASSLKEQSSADNGFQSIPENRQLPRLVDDADLLTDSEESDLLSKLDEISERQYCDVAIVTVDSLDGKTARAYADDFFDYNGYGMGNDDSGILLLISMEYRDWAISTYGFGIQAFTDAGQEYITEQILPDLSDGNYAASFNQFAALADRFLTQAKTGNPYDYGNLPKGPLSLLWTLVAIGAGLLIAWIIVSIMKSSLKSVQPKNNASDYVRNGSMHLTVAQDMFLYRTVSRSARPKSSSSSGGSSTHSSSSGRSHGGSSGKF